MLKPASRVPHKHNICQRNIHFTVNWTLCTSHSWCNGINQSWRRDEIQTALPCDLMLIVCWRPTRQPGFKSCPHEHIFCGKFFSDHFYLLVYVRKLARILCDNYIWWKTGAPLFMWQRKNVICESSFVCTTRHRKLATYSEVGSRFFAFVSTIQSFLAHRQTSFQHSISRLYIRANIFVTENLPQRICSCGLWFMLLDNHWQI